MPSRARSPPPWNSRVPATAEIARNVTETAIAADEMTKRTADVSQEAGDTGRHATDVRENVFGLNEAIKDLRRSVIRVVRTSDNGSRSARRHSLWCRSVLPAAG